MTDTIHTTKTTPTCHAEKCPVCNGFTTVSYGRKVCEACKGKGYILVPNELEEEDRGGRKRVKGAKINQ